MPSTWGDRTPRVVERDGRKVWVSGDAVLGPWGVYGPGVTGGRRGRILAEAGFASGTQTRPSNPIERRQDQERDGVEAEVIYGIIGVSRGLFTHSGIADHETLAAVYRAYNDYIADFNRSQPGRFFGLGCLPNHDARAAAGGRDLSFGDPVRRLRSPSRAHLDSRRKRHRLAAVHARAPRRHLRRAARRRPRAQAAAERVFQAPDVRDLPEGLLWRARDGGDRARQRHVGLGLSAPRRHLAVLAEGDRGAVPRHSRADPVEDALG